MKCLKCLQTISGAKKYGLHEQCFVDWFKVDVASEFESLKKRSAASQDADLMSSASNTSFYHGKFKKYSADLGEESYILKMRDVKEAPELPEIEHLCNQIAVTLGLPVPEHQYINFFSDPVFVAKVFIRKNGGNVNLEHIYKFRSDSHHDCETLMSAIAETTKRPYDVEVFLDTLLFDALIGNHDRHGRNLAFIVTPSKTILSPIYDNVSYLSLESGPMLAADFNPPGKIATKKTKEPSMRHYVDELKRLGCQEAVASFAQRVKVTKIEMLIDQSFCSDLLKAAFKILFQKRYKELINAL